MNMNNRFDINEFVEVNTISSVLEDLVERMKKRRKELKWSQKELSKRSGVAYASIRRFEETKEISLISLLKIANAMDKLSDFNFLFKDVILTNLKDYEI